MSFRTWKASRRYKKQTGYSVKQVFGSYKKFKRAYKSKPYRVY